MFRQVIRHLPKVRLKMSKGRKKKELQQWIKEEHFREEERREIERLAKVAEEHSLRSG